MQPKRRVKQKIRTVKPTPANQADVKTIWINPVGGLGDILLLSSVLKLVHENDPQAQFNLVSRSIYNSFFTGHPAINVIGSPPKDAVIICSDYWAKEELGAKNQRPFQILARLFGLCTPVEEKLFFSGNLENNDELIDRDIDWVGKKVAVIAPTSDSPRKMAHPMHWHFLVEKLKKSDIFVVQVGRMNDLYIKGAYSLLGLTDHKQLINIIKKCHVVVSVDNYIMHLSQLVKVPAVVLWGPTDSEVYGYPNQIHLNAPLDHCRFKNECLGNKYPQNYPTPCPLAAEQCMNKIPIDFVLNNIYNILQQGTWGGKHERK